MKQELPSRYRPFLSYKLSGNLSYLLFSIIFQIHQAEADLKRVFITHTGCDADAQFLKSELLKIAPIQEICITSAGSVIASHCGPGTIGVLYLLD